jgi:hypothetical protein
VAAGAGRQVGSAAAAHLLVFCRQVAGEGPGSDVAWNAACTIVCMNTNKGRGLTKDVVGRWRGWLGRGWLGRGWLGGG